MLTQEQLDIRKTRISATDIGAIIGVNPWKTAADVQAEKLYDLEPLAQSEAIEIGHMLEPALVEWCAKKIGEPVDPYIGTIVSERWPVLCATPDAKVAYKSRGVEAKTAGIVRGFAPAEEWGEAGSSDIPPQYYAQTQFQLAVTGWDMMYLPALIAGRGRVLYEIPRSNDDIEAMIDIAVHWHDRHILNREPVPEQIPEYETLKRIRRVPASVAIVEPALHAALVTAKAVLKEAELAKEHAQAAYVHALGDCEAGECELGMFTFMRQSRTGIDLEQLRAEFPEAAEACKKISSFPVLREKKARKGRA